jgi:hypothetical protein
MDAQRAIETLAAELAAEHATQADQCKAQAPARTRRRRSSTTRRPIPAPAATFHLAVAEASHNRVLVTQLISLQHVSWPAENRTLTPQVARRVLDVHRELFALIEMRDAAAARHLMDDHVKMIRARRVAEHAQDTITTPTTAAEQKPGRTPCATRNSSSCRTSGCTNGSPRRRATSRTKASEYEFQETVQSSDGKAHAQGDKVGAMQTIEKGRTSDISCACHWTINVAAAKGHGKLYGDAYSVSPCGVFVPQDSKIKTPEDLAGVPISVGYQSGSHYATIQALEQYMPLDQINLSYKEGMLFSRMDLLFEGKIPGLHAVLRAVLLRRAARFPQSDRLHLHDGLDDHRRAGPEDVRKFFRALKRAQRDIDLRPELYTRFYKNEFPKRYHDKMDTRRWGPGERIVFESYSREVFEDSRKWIADHGIFADTGMGGGQYEGAIVTLAGVTGGPLLSSTPPLAGKVDERSSSGGGS